MSAFQLDNSLDCNTAAQIAVRSDTHSWDIADRPSCNCCCGKNCTHFHSSCAQVQSLVPYASSKSVEPLKKHASLTHFCCAAVLQEPVEAD